MKVLVALDSFKGSINSKEANEAVKKALDDHDVICKAIGDGGDRHIFWYIVNAAKEHNIVYTSIAAKEEANIFLENIAMIIKEETFNL